MKLLLAVDGSDHSYEAVRSLKYLSRADELHVAHVVDVPTPAYPMMMPEVAQELYDTLERNMREDGTRLLDRIVSLLPMDSGPVTKHLVVGSPADQLVHLSEQHRIDLTLLGTRGLGPIRERLIGSVAHRLVTFGAGAKLVIPIPMKALSNVLLPLQGASDADQAVALLRHKPFRQGVTITLFAVLPHTRPPWPVERASAEEMETRSLESARDFLSKTARMLSEMGYVTKVHAALGTPVEGILEEAKAMGADLIVMGSRGRHGVSRLVLGSVSHALLHQGAYPLLIFG